MPNIILENIPVKDENIVPFLEKNINKLSFKRIITLIEKLCNSNLFFKPNIVLEILRKITNDKVKEEIFEYYLNNDIDENASPEKMKLYYEIKNKMIFEVSDKYKANYIEKNIDKIENIFLEHIIESLSSDDLKLKEIDKYDKLSERAIEKIIENILNNPNNNLVNLNDLIKYIDKLNNKNILNLIENLSNEKEGMKTELITRYIERFSDDEIRGFVEHISDELKLKLLDIVPNNLIKNIVFRINNDSLKVQMLSKYEDILKDTDITSIINSIKNDELKVKAFVNFSNKKNIFDYELKRIIEGIKDEYQKNKIILYAYAIDKGEYDIASEIKDEAIIKKLSLELIDNLDGEDISRIINSLSNYDYKIELLSMKQAPINLLYINRKMLENEVVQNMFFNELKANVKDYSENKNSEYLEMANYLCETNDEIFSTLNFTLFEEKYLNMLSDKNGQYPSLRVIGRYKEIQDKIIEIGNNNIDFCTKLIKTIINFDFDYTKILSDILEVVPSIPVGKYSLDELNQIVNNIIYISSNLKKFQLIMPLDSDKILNVQKIINVTINEKMKSENIKEKKEAVLLKQYGIDIDTAEELINRFGQNLETLNTYGNVEYDQLKVILYGIKKVLYESSIDNLEILFNQTEKEEHKFFAGIEATCRKMYGNQISNELISVESMKKLDNPSSISTQDIYTVFDYDKINDFNILLTSLGAYTNFQKPANYKDDWLRPKLGSHGFCASLISNEMMGTARVKYACFGFSKIPDESLLLQGPYDLVSNDANKQFDVTDSEAYNKSKYLSSKSMIDNTRHTHNELVIERLIAEGKLLPDYTIFMTEEYNAEDLEKYKNVSKDDLKIIEEFLKINKFDKKTKEKYEKLIIDVKKILENVGITNLNSAEEIEEKAQECQYWVNTVQASNDFEIPIVVIERRKIREHEVKVVNEMLQEFKNTHDSEILVNMLVRFANNRAGCREYYVEDGFDKESAQELINQIYAEIESMLYSDEYDKAQVCINSLKDWFKIEEQKTKNNAGANVTNVDKSLGFDIYDFEQKMKLYSSIKRNDVKNNEYNGHYSAIIEELGNNDYLKQSRAQVKQYSLNEIKEKYGIVSDLVDLSINDKICKASYNYSKIHGPRHIEDVILFTALVGQESLKGNNRTKLLELSMEASKYHDCGRVSDNESRHAEPGALKAYEILSKQGKYNALELAIIYIAIYNHEFNIKNVSVEELKEKLKDSSNQLLKDTFMSIIKTGTPNSNITYTRGELIEAICNKKFIGDMNTSNIFEDVNQVVNLVRDADALDRTRFVDGKGASLKQEYLSEEAKKFVDYSYAQAEYYATRDLEEMKAEGKIDDELIIKIMQDPGVVLGKPVPYTIKNNKELMRFIRHNPEVLNSFLSR